jgi:hypothetical protein
MNLKDRLIAAEQQLEQAKANANFWAGQAALLKELLAPPPVEPPPPVEADDA